jgi:sugar lactone lactonase YvrE
MTDKPEQITGPVAYHAEGPVWHPGWGGLRWVDMLAGDVLSFDAAGAVARTHVGEVAAAIRPRTGGGMVVGIERGFALVDPSRAVTKLPELWAAGPIRMNDGGCDPDGRFYCGSISKDTTGAAALYRLDPDGSVTVVLRDLTISNGLAWSPDGTLAYFNDTKTQHVDVFDYDSRAGLTNRRHVVVIPPETGSPDGLTVDAEGHVWVALWGGGAVHRYAPDGRLEAVIELPVKQVSAVALGGDDLRDLYITTSRENLPAGVDPDGGSLYRVRVDVPGTIMNAFRG